MSLSLAQAEEHLAAWRAADLAVAKGQAYSVGGRTVTRADAKTVRENVEYWERRVNELAQGGAGGARVRYGVVSR
jgi:hypothetical protein